MKDFGYVIENFFTHKDFLVPPHLIPGTIGTPLSIVFEVALLAFIIVSAVYVSKRKRLVKPVLVGLWAVLVVWEFGIIYWNSVSGRHVGLDLVLDLPLYPCSIYLYALPMIVLWAVLVVWEFGIIYWNSVSGRHVGLDLVLDLPLYPCSIYLYALPMIVWGNAFWRRLGCGYMATLGVLGAVVNFVYPVARLTTYSCISFAGFHTFSFHGSMLFTWLVLLRCGMLHYGGAKRVRDLFTPQDSTPSPSMARCCLPGWCCCAAGCCTTAVPSGCGICLPPVCSA